MVYCSPQFKTFFGYNRTTNNIIKIKLQLKLFTNVQMKRERTYCQVRSVKMKNGTINENITNITQSVANMI